MSIRQAAVDIGNDALKAYVQGLDQEVYIPNVIAEIGPSRDIVEFEKHPLDGLHVEILSGALKRGQGIYAVGNLAGGYTHNDELSTVSEKSEADQPVVMLLTALAYDAAQTLSEQDGVIEATYYLSTGLPLSEAKRGKRKTFKAKLKENTHEVRFKTTPEIGGKVVRLKFEEVLVNIEGHVALIDLTTNEDGTVRNEELTRMTVLINDIGGLSTDAAIIHEDGTVDNIYSDGIKEGVSPYLDEIIERVQHEIGYRFLNRQQLVEVITSVNKEERNYIWFRGKRISIQSIVDEVLAKIAREEYKLIRNSWSKVPSIRVSYQIGGGSLLLKPYLEKINEQEEGYPLRFVGAKDSIWMIARAYYKLLAVYLQYKNEQVSATTK
ncbi:plasmid segregation protein ParM [Paenibacillus sophorae]|uniref:ParM/StbA family protein n=1 Tax=Paenibacillus sophorae TaxID=1333845 RepID=A0A1H8VGS0_9BACL|nr:ParM/StbA family protein [Paenibacillus sophorae]QWU15410.1 ParM/StbA family protein [Paenibacillus sophorae]SEP14484.1 plasmid segregation protein ParM [Paenibacillus sophorae]